MRCHGILLPLLLVVVMLAGLASAQTRRRQQARRQSNIRRVTRVGRPRVLLPSAPRSDEAPPPPLTQSGRGNRNGFGTEVTTSATPGVTNQREVSSRQRRTDINSVATERRTSRPTIVTTERRTERPTIVTTERRTDRPTVVTTEREQTEERRTASPTGETPSRERGRGVAGAPSGDMDTAASVTTEMLTQAISQATNAVDLLHSLEREILEKGLIAKASGTVAQQNRASRTSQEAKDLSVSALVSLEATKLLAERLGLDANQAQSLELVNITDTLLSDICLQTALVPPCIPGRYREPTGYCNNILNPRWGTSHVALRRMVANAYENGLDIMRFTSIDDSLLPSPRLISTSLHPSTSDLHSKISLMVMQWGQFIDHDIGLTPFTTECLWDICSVSQTAFIDGSMIYGNIDSLAESLRTGQRGLLKYTDHPGGNNLKYLLPQDTTNGDCQRTSESDNCFVAGDARSNEQVGLTSMHTILLREHNRIAEKLAKVNKYWDDETLYQEARRIVVAEIQHITYDAWLPIVLGHEHVNRGKDSDLALVNAGFYTEYDVETDPGLVNAFSTAAFRFGHSLLPDALLRLDATGTKRDPLPLREAFFRPAPIYDTSDTGGIDALMRGIATQNAEKMDSKVTAEVTEHLFQESGKPYGLDLVSLNLQRGRDHGLPGYNVYREACGLQRALTFKDLGNVMDEEQIAVLSKLYKGSATSSSYPDDIDLFSAGLSERPMPGGLVGPTFGCIISRQFTRLRRGDRFWYENDMPTNRFTLDQLTEIRKASLTRLLCDNGDSITTMQPNAYLIPDAYTNKRVNCDAIPKLDLSKWKDNKFQNFVKLSDQVVEQSVFLATENIKNLGELERQAYELGFGRLTDDNDPQVLHAAFLASSDYIQLVGRTARLLINATGVMQKFQKLSRRDLLERMGGLQLPDTIIPPEEDQCVAPLFVSCDYNTKYREVTGRCNNLRNLEMGMCLRPFRRLLEPVYDDVINTMRSTSVTTRALPSPRAVSNAVHRSMDAPHEEYTLALMQWGQFLDHDITFTPVSKGFNNSVLNCGRCDSAMSVSQECQPVSIPTDDSFFPATTADGSPHCMAFARSSPITDKKFGPRQQMNQITSFIDASNVYGSTMCRKEQLREGRGGRMRMQPNGNRKPLLTPLA
ncbi:PREDICTED: lactoperoxidase-like, partial [Priapulus caudatus]|uniref:Lactoperoxidase-like n=1 Tax=Priapulus caudatus TaxID=37621 RepID=A0ABM1EWK3_PRICU